MYLPYLMYGYAATAFLLLLGCRMGALTVPGLRAVRLLSWALVFAIISVLLLSLRPYAPAWITILLANEALLVCILLVYRAAADTFSAPIPFLPWGIGLAILALAGNIWFTYVHDQLAARIVIVSSTCAIYAAAIALLLRKHLPAEKQSSASTSLRSLTAALAWLQVLVVVLQAARGVRTILHPPTEILHIGIVQAGFTYLIMLVNVATGCGLIWLALCRHRRDLQLLAQTDSLTGLLNRRAFEEILYREMRRSAQAGEQTAVLMLDIDRFKDVNDSLGHHAGDEVIQRVSAVLRGKMRPLDVLARYGGDEFVILSPDTTEAQAEEIAQRLVEEISGLHELPGGRVTVSIGAAASRPGDTVEHLLRRSDEAMYCSKRGGRNRVTVDWAQPEWPAEVSRAY
jgi:diguanylate cyclase (GGDEF)-like protein